MRGIRIFITGLAMLLGVAVGNPCATAQDASAEVGKCLQKGSAACLSDHIGLAITLIIDGERSTYSRSQADMVLRDFFRKSNPRSFKIVRVSANLVNGVLTTQQGSYQVYITLNTVKGQYVMQEIKIEQ